MNRIEFIIRQAGNDRTLRGKLRCAYTKEILKLAEDGILQNYKGNDTEYASRPNVLVERGRDKLEENLYGVNPASYSKTDISVRDHSETLSTRYVPGKPGVLSERVRGTNGGIVKDPNTNKIYDWNEGFTDEHGHQYNGGSVQGQSSLYAAASTCHPRKLIKISMEDEVSVVSNYLPKTLPVAILAKNEYQMRAKHLATQLGISDSNSIDFWKLLSHELLSDDYPGDLFAVFNMSTDTNTSFNEKMSKGSEVLDTDWIVLTDAGFERMLKGDSGHWDINEFISSRDEVPPIYEPDDSDFDIEVPNRDMDIYPISNY
jgi:hypothetical protein